MKSVKLKRVVFLDRDGVINRRRRDYVKSLEEFEILPGAVEAIARLSSQRRVIVLTNQSAIGRGLVPFETVLAMHSRLAELVAEAGGKIDGFVICPHTPSDGCSCRKPAPGLFYRARDELGADLAGAVMVGDQPSDAEAAQAAGLKALLVGPEGDYAGLPEATDAILDS